MEKDFPLKQFRVGLSRGQGDFPQEVIEIHQQRLSAAATLRDLAEDYEFYTPALMYMGVRLMGREPFWDFVRENEQQVVPITVKFNRPVFEGMTLRSDTSWNYVLWGLEKEHWQAYLRWMGTLAFLDREHGSLIRLRTQEVAIADPLFFDRCVVMPVHCPTVPITVFVLEGNQGCCYIRAGAHPLMDLPRVVVTSQFYKDTAAFTQALLDEADNPYRDAYDTRALPGVSFEKAEIQARVAQARKEEQEGDQG